MILLENDELLLSQEEFDALPEYSVTFPTDRVPGKAWKRREPYWSHPKHAVWKRGVFGLPYPEGHKFYGEIPIGWRVIRIAGTAPRWPVRVRVPPRPIGGGAA